MRLNSVVWLVFAGAGCSSTHTDPPFTACTLGTPQFTGTFRVSYLEQSGDCGPIPDETVVLAGTPAQMSAQAKTASAGCTYQADTISADKCRVDESFTCPLKAPYKGTQQWAGYLRQTSATTLEGPLTVQLASSAAACRSTYEVIFTGE